MWHLYRREPVRCLRGPRLGGDRLSGDNVISRQRRQHERVAARFPVWINSNGSGRMFQGHTANVSMGGMLLFTATDFDLPLGAPVGVTFGIREEDHGGYAMHEAPSGAKIVRVERYGYGVGIAVQFDKPELARCAFEPVLV